MNYGKLTDFWRSFGVTMGDDARSSSEPSGSVVEDFGGEPSTSNIQGSITSTISTMEQKLQNLVNRFVSRIEEENWKDSGYYISDVYACESPERARGVAKRLEQRAESYRRGFIGISIHGNHVHSIHSCPYTSRTCRCSFKNFPEAKEDIRRLLRKPRAIETFKRSDWENITKYFCTSGRRTTFFKIFGTLQRIPLEITSLSDSTISSEDGRGSDSSVENCRDPLELHSGFETPDIPARPRSKRQCKRSNPIILGGAGGVGGTTGIILDLLNKYAVCPLTGIVYTKEYLENSNVACKRLDSLEVKNAIDARASVLNTWKYSDFVDFYNKESTVLIWSALSVDEFDTYYYSYDESQDIILKLLQHQLGEGIYNFANDLINILERNVPKRNCFVVISPPSAGKNYFFDAIRDFYLSAGQMNNPNKYNQFAYQDCHNRRIIVWNEPNYEPRETENLKMLFAGDNISANVKCKPQANVKRTPIIVLSNNQPLFTRQSEFNDRVLVYYWQKAPFLKECNKKPRPDAVMHLLYSLQNKINM